MKDLDLRERISNGFNGDLHAKAIVLVVSVMSGQVDRSGHPLWEHSLRVGAKSRDVDGKVAGTLHDVVEDTDVTLDDLLYMGFPENIVKAVESVTRIERPIKETYAAFIERSIAGGKLAIRVKLNDIDDNLTRIAELPEGEGMRKRYMKAKQRLLAAWEYTK